MSKPYFYKIKHNASGKLYVGSQYGNNANKDNLLTTYFTSSKIVNAIIKDEGINAFSIVKLIERSDAREFECYYLTKCYRMLGKAAFLETFINQSTSPGIILTPDVIAQQTATKKDRWAAGTLEKPVPPNWKGKTRSDAMRKKLSESKMGHSVSTETREKLRKANLGKKQSADTIANRKAALASNENAYGRKHWLLISPEGKHYYTIGDRNTQLHLLGLNAGPTFYKYLNTGTAVATGKNAGWYFYEGKETINAILINILPEFITYNER